MIAVFMTDNPDLTDRSVFQRIQNSYRVAQLGVSFYDNGPIVERVIVFLLESVFTDILTTGRKMSVLPKLGHPNYYYNTMSLNTV